MTAWADVIVAADRSHHHRGGEPLYPERYDDVLDFRAPGLAPVRLKDRAWHIGLDGAAGYARRFQRTFGFYEGLATVVSPDGWHHIDAAGADAYPQRFDWCGNFQGRRCAVRATDHAYFHIDPHGDPAYGARWRYVGDYRDGLAVVQGANGRSTHIDLAGEIVHGRWFLDLDAPHKGYARARDEDGWCHVDCQGQPAYATRFAMVEPFYNGQARVETLDGALLVIDEGGRILVPLHPATLPSPAPPPPPRHAVLIEGFRAIKDKNALAWTVLDSKGERFIIAAIATSINRRTRRIAHIEFSRRIDLAVLHDPLRHRTGRYLDAASSPIQIRYEAKAGQLFDFARSANTLPRYLGAELDDDMAEMTLGEDAGLFFVAEVADANRHLKYFAGHVATIDDVKAVLCQHVTRGSLVAHESIDCGIADGTSVKIHMFVFDPVRGGGPLR
jgi:hypothetical protein